MVIGQWIPVKKACASETNHTCCCCLFPTHVVEKWCLLLLSKCPPVLMQWAQTTQIPVWFVFGSLHDPSEPPQFAVVVDLLHRRPYTARGNWGQTIPRSLISICSTHSRRDRIFSKTSTLNIGGLMLLKHGCIYCPSIKTGSPTSRRGSNVCANVLAKGRYLCMVY